jgi:hypothetical protein
MKQIHESPLELKWINRIQQFCIDHDSRIDIFMHIGEATKYLKFKMDFIED